MRPKKHSAATDKREQQHILLYLSVRMKKNWLIVTHLYCISSIYKGIGGTYWKKYILVCCGRLADSFWTHWHLWEKSFVQHWGDQLLYYLPNWFVRNCYEMPYMITHLYLQTWYRSLKKKVNNATSLHFIVEIWKVLLQEEAVDICWNFNNSQLGL